MAVESKPAKRKRTKRPETRPVTVPAVRPARVRNADGSDELPIMKWIHRVLPLGGGGHVGAGHSQPATRKQDIPGGH